MQIEIGVLGDLECCCDGAWIDVRGRRQRVLLAALAAAAPESLSSDQLIAEIWIDADLPAHPRRALQTVISRLRATLGPVSGRDRVTKHVNGYALLLSGDELDASRFENLVAEAATKPPTNSVGLLELALELWRGEPYREFSDCDFARIESGRLRELRLVAVERLARAHLDVGDADNAVGVIESVVREHPLRESAIGTLMRALYVQGRQADALSHFQAYRLLLADELGLEPGPALRQVEHDILSHQMEDSTPTRPAERRSESAATITFLVAEIENAEGLWARYPEETQLIVEHLDVVVRGAVDSAGGDFWSSGSYRLSAAFTTAGGAVLAAIDVQRALEAERWPGPIPPLVRIGLHTGSAAGSAGVFRGPTAHRAERLMLAAHGGQIVVSASTAALLRSAGTDDFVLIDIGRHRLIELASPEVIYQIVADGLRPQFPPVRLAGDVPGNLPAGVDALVGRSRLIEYVTSLSVTARLITLTGTAGIGKSRLALGVARRISPQFADGVWLSELAPAADEAAAADALATSLGVEAAPGSSFVDGLTAGVGHAELLLVLDNCEHVVDFAATTTASLLERCPNLSIITTSREALSIVGEHVVNVPPLDDASAAELFVERATAQFADFGVDDSNESTVSLICERLDRIPLAIEIAASRVRSLSPGDILDRLERSQTDLAGSGRRVDRHRTVRSAIEWSYRLLEPAEAAFFDRLSVFVGGFTVGAASAICAGGSVAADDAADLVDQLVFKSLASTVEGAYGIRFEQYEALRQVGAEHLEANDETSMIRKAHLRYFTDAACGLREIAGGPRQLEARSSFESDYANFRSAFSTAVAFDDASAAVELATVDDITRQLSSRPLSWTATALAVPGTEHSPRRTVAAASAAFAAISHDADEEAAERWLHQGFTWLAEPGAVPDPYLYGVEALLALGRGDITTMVRAGEDSIRLARATGNNAVLAYELATHAMFTAATRSTVGRDESQQYGEEAVELARRIENSAVLNYALSQLAWIVHRSDPDLAVALRDEGLELTSSQVPEVLQASGRAILAVDRNEDPTEFMARSVRVLREVRDLQVEHPVWLAALAWAVDARRADLAAQLLGNLGDQQTPWLSLKRAATDIRLASDLVAADLTEDEARERRAQGARASRATIIDQVLTALTPADQDGAS